MRYNPKARLDRSQVTVRRGGSRGGGMGIPSGGGGNGIKVGGGIGGLVILVLVLLLQSQLGGGGSATDTSLEQCEGGADADQDRNCALVADVNSIQGFWQEALPEQTGTPYRRAQTMLFTGGTDTDCGGATSDVGPFYCSVDETVYLDTTFFDDMLEAQLGAQGGGFAEAYVLAHEYGHHVQNLLGTMGQVRTQQGRTSDAVRLELQADCYAGIWAKNATEVPDASGEPYILELTQQDIESALDAARSVGDDTIQKETGNPVDSEHWTHGSSAARVHWFTVGFQNGTLAACNTFNGQPVE